VIEVSFSEDIQSNDSFAVVFGHTGGLGQWEYAAGNAR
jgi:hypothetical protein